MEDANSTGFKTPILANVMATHPELEEDELQQRTILGIFHVHKMTAAVCLKPYPSGVRFQLAQGKGGATKLEMLAPWHQLRLEHDFPTEMHPTDQFLSQLVVAGLKNIPTSHLLGRLDQPYGGSDFEAALLTKLQAHHDETCQNFEKNKERSEVFFRQLHEKVAGSGVDTKEKK